MNITIIDITEWIKDYQLIDGDASHEGDQSVKELVYDEEMKKIYSAMPWTLGLPFNCEVENKDEALDLYNQKYCCYDYLKASNCDIELTKI